MENNSISLCMTWANALAVCLILLESGNAKAKRAAKKELETMAKLADSYVDSITSPVQHPEPEIN